MSYTPLHLHSSYSLLDGAIHIPDLIQFLKEQGITSCAVSDHGTLSGILEFYKAATKEGIRPLIAMEAYLTEDSDGLPKEQRTRDNFHFLLIAKDNEGYQQLLELSSRAYLENFYYKPRIFKENLKRCRGHVIATSACLASPISRRLTYDAERQEMLDPEGRGQREMEYFANLFGDDFYLELQDWGEANEQQAYNRYLLYTGRKLGLPFVLTSDAHYLKPEDFEFHQILMALQMKQTLEEYKASGKMIYGPWFYVKTPAEMLASAQKLGCAEAYYNTQKIAEQCQVTLELNTVHYLPTFDLAKCEDREEFEAWKTKKEMKRQSLKRS